MNKTSLKKIPKGWTGTPIDFWAQFVDPMALKIMNKTSSKKKKLLNKAFDESPYQRSLKKDSMKTKSTKRSKKNGARSVKPSMAFDASSSSRLGISVIDGQTITLTIRKNGGNTLVTVDGSWPCACLTTPGLKHASLKPKLSDTSFENTTVISDEFLRRNFGYVASPPSVSDWPRQNKEKLERWDWGEQGFI